MFIPTFTPFRRWFSPVTTMVSWGKRGGDDLFRHAIIIASRARRHPAIANCSGRFPRPSRYHLFQVGIGAPTGQSGRIFSHVASGPAWDVILL
jgi:hypothetical protein